MYNRNQENKPISETIDNRTLFINKLLNKLNKPTSFSKPH